jgi:preprotein translocase subunit YajC
VIDFLAQATQPTGGEPSLLYTLTHGPFPLIIVFLVVMYITMVMPKRKQDKTRQAMLTNMKRGDEVQTIGGIVGKVVEAREDRVLVKVDETSNTKIWFLRSAVARVTAEETKSATK